MNGTQGHRARPSRGFTVVELLVVLAIIVLLIAILLPSMGIAREHARTLRCQINMRQLIEAQLMYSTDNHRTLAHPNWLSKEDNTGEMNWPGWLYQYPDRSKLEHIESGALWKYINDYDVYRCISHDGEFVGTERITSYCLNGSLVRYGNANDPKYFETFRLSRWNPEDIFFWETDEESSWWNDGSNYPYEFATGRHPLGQDRGAGNVAMAGGGVKWLSEQEYLDLAYSPVKNALWNVPDSSNGRQ